MEEGKILLYTIIDNKLKAIEDLDTSCLYCDGISLVELYNLLKSDQGNFYMITDNILDKIIEFNSVKNKEIFKRDAISVRDLLIGKKEYNLKVNIIDKYVLTIKSFIKYLSKYLNNIDQDILNKENITKRIKELKKKIDNNYLITDFELINELVTSYDSVNKDKNMLIIMKYINEINLILLKMKKKNAPIFDIQMIRRPKLNSAIKEVLDKLHIESKNLPNFLLSELKKTNPSEFISTYNILKKNKAENGGILHFIKKENEISKLLLILYSTEESIIEVVESVKDSKGIVDVKSLKTLVNNVPTCFYTKSNAYFVVKHQDYMKNISYLKKLKVNYRALIQKTPLFMIMSNEVLDYTLNYLVNCGASKRNIINRCYKSLAINPSLLIDNVDLLRLYNIDLKEYFGDKNTNYNLLKINNLDNKLRYLKNKYNINDKDNRLDYELVNKLLVNKVYREASVGNVSWGDEN